MVTIRGYEGQFNKERHGITPTVCLLCCYVVSKTFCCNIVSHLCSTCNSRAVTTGVVVYTIISRPTFTRVLTINYTDCRFKFLCVFLITANFCCRVTFFRVSFLCRCICSLGYITSALRLLNQ